MPKLVGIVTGGYTLLGAVTWARDELVKHNPADSAWHVVDFLPHWTFWQWGFGAVVIVLPSVLETSFQRKKEADVVHGGEVGKLNNEIVRLGRHIGELEERLKEGPTVLLSNVGNGINPRVESPTRRDQRSSGPGADYHLWCARARHGAFPKRTDTVKKPRCGAKTGGGTPCQAPAIWSIRCKNHSGMSTGPKTAQGLERIRRAVTKHRHYSHSRWNLESARASGARCCGFALDNSRARHTSE